METDILLELILDSQEYHAIKKDDQEKRKEITH